MGQANDAAATGAPPPSAPAAPPVRVLSVSRVTPAPVQHAADPVVVKLSFFDTPWVVLPPIQRVFLYELPAGSDGELFDFPAAVARLKASLAATLAAYLPLAGKLSFVPDTGDVVVDCSGDPAVSFVEADAAAAAAADDDDDGTTMAMMDVRRLAGDEAHDIPAFRALVPDLPTRSLPAPVLSVQATRLPGGAAGGGGIALGLSVHHAVADGQAVWRFMSAWASAARSAAGDPGAVVVLAAPPHFDRDVVRVPNGDESARQMLKMIAPNLPQTTALGDYDFSHRFQLARRTFHLAAADIKALKHRINALAASSSSTTTTKPVSTFVALAALGWTSFVYSKNLTAGEDTYLVFLADLRARLDPPVPDGYLGNCIKGVLASADAGDLLLPGAGGLLAAARAVQAAVAEMEAAPLAGTERWMEKMMGLPFTRLANVAASPRFRVYEAADFGFGRPARVELVSMNHDGEMVLVGGRSDGEVQLSVSLDPARMEEFKRHVFGCSSAAAAPEVEQVEEGK